jgi:hypothetical protein
MEILKKLQKKWWLLNRYFNFFKNRKRYLLAVFFLIKINCSGQQIANYINNGGFEDYNCLVNHNLLHDCKFWGGIDSLKCGGGVKSYCNGFAPYNGNTFQFPRTDSTYVIATFLWPSPGIRCYLRNRMKQNLKAGETYCVKFYINVTNTSPWGIDGFGVYFGDNSIDTISQSNIPLSYITPQISNPSGNVITDTLNWIPITGTFVANGNEKFAVIGNFKSDAAVNTASIGGPFYPSLFSDICIDDVSCIPINLSAYAYISSDAWILAGDSIYLGRGRDVGIDEACMWYKLPNTATVIDTAAGIWVKPSTTSTYIVKQEICSGIKSDTVIIHISGVGLHEKIKTIEYTIFPNPSSEYIEVQFYQPMETLNYSIENINGKTITEGNLVVTNQKARINLNFEDGIYFLKILEKNKIKSVKKLVVVN